MTSPKLSVKPQLVGKAYNVVPRQIPSVSSPPISLPASLRNKSISPRICTLESSILRLAPEPEKASSRAIINVVVRTCLIFYLNTTPHLSTLPVSDLLAALLLSFALQVHTARVTRP